MRLALVLYAVGLSGSLAAPARAEAEQRQTATLTHAREVGAEACPDEQALKDAVSGRLGYVPFQDSAPRRIDVTFSKAGGKLVATLRVERADAPAKTRKLESAPGECTELAQSVALAISVAIDPLGGARPTEAPPAIEPEPPQTPSPAPPPPVRSEPQHADRPQAVAPAPKPVDRSPVGEARWSPLLVAVARAALGELPEFSPGAGVGLGLFRGWLSLALWADVALPLAGEAGAGAYDAALAGATVRGCWHARALFVCALARGARLSAEGRDVDRPRSDAALTAGAGAGAGVRARLLPSVDAALGVDGLAQLSRVSLELDGRTFWSQPPASVAGWLSLSAAP
jgi:hypothetical protein